MNRFVLKNTFIKVYICHFSINIFKIKPVSVESAIAQLPRVPHYFDTEMT